MKTKKDLVDVTKYGDNKVSGDAGEDYIKNTDNLLKITIEGGGVVAGSGDDTGLGTVAQKLGLFDVKNKAQDKNTEDDDKIKADLEKNNLSSDPLSVGVSKIIKKKIENSSTPDTSSEEIDDMLIKVMKDIEQQEELINIMDDASGDPAYDNIEDISDFIDMVSNIEQTLASEDKLADQKSIDLKTKLGRAESEKKYLEEIIKAYEDAEKEGRFQTEGISSVKTRLEDTEQTINELKTEIQKHEDKLKEDKKEEIIEDQVSETTSTVKETQETSTDNKETEETIMESNKAPTIKLSIIDLDTESSPWIAIYTVQAVVTGEPFPTIGWSTGTGDQGKDTVKVYVKSYSSYNGNSGVEHVTGWAINSEGMAEDSIDLIWEDVWTEN